VAREKKPRDAWDKLAVVASLMVPVSVAAVGFMGTQYLHSRQAAETKDRLYVELQTSREKADGELRKSMFEMVIRTFLNKDTHNPEELVLALELLTYNFHEVIDLGPLFKYVEANLRQRKPGEVQGDHVKRLERAASEVVDKQLAALQDASTIYKDDVFFEDLSPQGIPLFTKDKRHQEGKGMPLTDPRPERFSTPAVQKFAKLDILGADTKHKELRVRLQVFGKAGPGEASVNRSGMVTEVDAVFKVGFYDFPVIDNTHLSDGRRIAVVLRSWEPERVEVALAYFPGSRASLKEKPYYDELVQQLQRLP
jgi:hypothetical protein